MDACYTLIALAIYEALIQANVPPPAARRVAESLEKDMTCSLMIQNHEARIVVKLGVSMTVLLGLAGTALALLR